MFARCTQEAQSWDPADATADLEVPDAGPDWSTAKCRDGAASMIGLFFSEQLDDIARAKAVCARCPVQEPCLTGALERREPWGVWGGQLFQNGRVLAFKRKRGRPRKDAAAAGAVAETGQGQLTA
ncbi:MAG: WhiB family transcriptional regulator [Acidimicrobiales bacterium]